MESVRQISKDAYPTVGLTIVSLIQAVVLERLVDAALGLGLGETQGGLLSWLQIAFVFLTVLHIFVT